MDTLYTLRFLNVLQLIYTRHKIFPKYKEFKLREKHIHMSKNQQNSHTTETSIQGKEELQANTGRRATQLLQTDKT
jgi:hypothetical protein